MSPLISCDAPTASAPAGEAAGVHSNAAGATSQQLTRYNPDRAALLKDFNTWYPYHYRQIRLAREFVGLDTAGGPLSRQAFLTRLASGQYVAFKTQTQAGVPYYQLYAPAAQLPNIAGVVKQSAETELRHLQMEGSALPAYAFTDLQGRRYTPETTRGKLLVLKCWFINCVACVQEFPQLNDLVARYQGRPDVLFVSLAFDHPQELTAFLAKREFRYAVVPQQRAYMQQQLAVDSYPTHILVNGEGRIVRVTNAIEDLEPDLAKLAPPPG